MSDRGSIPPPEDADPFNDGVPPELEVEDLTDPFSDGPEPVPETSAAGPSARSLAAIRRARQARKADPERAAAPAHDEGAEEAVLGALLGRPDECLPAVRPILEPKTFYREAHQALFATMLQIADEGGTLCPATVANAMPPDPELTQDAAQEYLDGLLLDWGTMGGGITGVEAEDKAWVIVACAQERAADEALEEVRKGRAAGKGFEELSDQLAKVQAGAESLTSASPLRHGLTGEEIAKTDYPDMRWAIPGLLPEGFTIFGGPPKIGKSYMALQIAQAVATSGHFLGQTPEAGNILFFALEDSERRIKKRMTEQQWRKCRDRVRFLFPSDLPERATDALRQIAAEIRKGEYRLVVIDTLGIICGATDFNDYKPVTDDLHILQTAALSSQTVLLGLHHHCKGKSGDPVDDLLGSRGFGASPDGIIGLYRQGTEQAWTLRARGRDLESDQEIAVSRDKEFKTWHIATPEEQIRPETLQSEVFDVLAAANKQMTAMEIVGALKVRGREARREKVVTALSALVGMHAIERIHSPAGSAQPYRLSKRENR